MKLPNFSKFKSQDWLKLVSVVLIGVGLILLGGLFMYTSFLASAVKGAVSVGLVLIVLGIIVFLIQDVVSD